jgi:hypothetical protein
MSRELYVQPNVIDCPKEAEGVPINVDDGVLFGTDKDDIGVLWWKSDGAGWFGVFAAFEGLSSSEAEESRKGFPSLPYWMRSERLRPLD